MFKADQLEKGDSAEIKFKKEPEVVEAYKDTSPEEYIEAKSPEEYIEAKTYSIEYALAHLEEGNTPKK
jgi:hypothetical protein